MTKEWPVVSRMGGKCCTVITILLLIINILYLRWLSEQVMYVAISWDYIIFDNYFYFSPSIFIRISTHIHTHTHICKTLRLIVCPTMKHIKTGTIIMNLTNYLETFHRIQHTAGMQNEAFMQPVLPLELRGKVAI